MKTSALNDVIMDYFTSRDEGSDDEVTKEESDDSLYMHRCANSCAALAFLNVNYKVHNLCYLNIQGVIKSSETMPMMNNEKLSSSG